MRILHFNQFRSFRGGVESYIADVANALNREGHPSHLVSFTPDEPAEIVTSASRVSLPVWPGAIDAAKSSIEKIIKEYDPDVAYVHGVYHPGLVIWLAQQLPSIAYVHGPYPVCPGSAQYLRNSARVCPHTAGMICLINAQREQCCWGRNPIKHWRLLQRTRQFTAAHHHLQRLIVGSNFMQQLLLHNGVAVEKTLRMAPVLIEPTSVREAEHGDARTVLFAGRLTAEKGLTHLIQALATNEEPWQLIVAGEGPQRELCEALAGQLGVADQVKFLGWQNADQITQLYRQCAVVAIPSLWPEPFGRIGPEAFVHGRPVVAYGIGGIPDWLDDGETGFLVTPADVVQLGRRLRQLLAIPELGRQMGAQAQQRALARWNSAQHVKELLQVFSEAIASVRSQKD